MGRGNRALTSNNVVLLLIIICVLSIVLSFIVPSIGRASPQATPPLVTASVKPNLMIIFDTSGSMRWGKSGLSYTSDGVYVISKKIYNDPFHGVYWYPCRSHLVIRNCDCKAEVIQIAGHITDSNDEWLPVLPGLSGRLRSYRYNPSVFIDITGHIDTIKSSLRNRDHATITLGGIKWIVFKGSWGADNPIFYGPYGYGYISRLTVAKWVISKLIKNSSGINYGIMKFQEGCSQRTGAKVVFPCTDLTEDYDHNGHLDRDDLINYVDSIWADACTPLANSLYEASRYFGGQSSSCGARYSGAFASKIMVHRRYVSPIDYWCQKNFVILMTDGESYEDGGCVPSDVQDYDHDNNSHDGSHETSDSLDDVALYGYETDFAPSLGSGDTARQNFSTYTIGFGGAGAELLQEAADNSHGHGHYYESSNQAELYNSLQAAVNDIMYRISSGTAVAVMSTSQSTGDRLFRAKFHSLGWKGFLECLELPYTSGGLPLWEAGELLRNRDPDYRTIYTATSASSTTQENFDTDNRNLTATMLGVPASDRDHLINFIRGDYSASWGYRDRDPNGNGGNQWKLGDIVNSTPVFRAEPNASWDSVAASGSSSISDYSFFKSNRSGRTPLVIVGANDGMTHAFNVSNGSEEWAFVPHNLLYNLKSLGNDPYAHNYYVDLTPVVTDCKIGSSVSGDHGWKTVLMSGERQGGKAYFALDITGDSGYPLPLWEFTDGDLGESWSIPQVGLVKTGSATSFKWVGIFGSGYDNADSKGYLFGINMADATPVFKIKVDDSTGNAMASPSAIDFDDNNCIDRVYIGDKLGRMWKATIPEDATRTTVSVLTDAGSSQPIRVKPSLSLYDRTGGKVVAVYFGTGKFDEISDKTITDTQSFYCILDEGTLPVTRSDLVNSDSPGISGYCSENGKLPASKRGWYFDLPNTGERVISDSLLAGGIVFFTTFTPNDDPCGYGGVARLYAVKYDTGCAPDNPVLDVNGNNIVDATDTTNGTEEGIVPKSIIIGNGIPSAPVYDARNKQVIVQTSDTTIHSRAAKLPLNSFKIHFWREVF